jgi:DNA-binding MarR family transcriptional regulator
VCVTTVDLFRLGLQIKQVQQRKQVAVDAVLAPLGASFSQWIVLRIIAAHPGSSGHVLAQLTFQTDQSFGALVSRLAERGLVERTRGPGRSLLHRLTAEGFDLLERCDPLVAEALNDQFGILDDAELGQLQTILERVLGDVRTGDPATLSAKRRQFT